MLERIRTADRALAAVCTVAAMLLGADPAQSQQRSGAVFQTLLNVDVASGNVGSVGCGGGSGVELSDLLGDAQNQGGENDEDRPIAERRALFRYCDVQTPDGANGWTNDVADDLGNGISAEQDREQATLLSPEELFAGMDGAHAAYDIQAANVARRLGLLRVARRDAGSRAVAFRGAPSFRLGRASVAAPLGGGGGTPLLALQDGLQTGDPAHGDGLGVFLNGRVLVIEGDGNRAERGSDSVGGGATLGVDTRLGSLGFAGGAFGYTRVDTHYDRSGSEASLDAFTFSLYGAAYPSDASWVDLSVTGSYLLYDSENEILIFDSGPPVARIEGDTDGGSIGADLGVGIDFPIRGFTLSPQLRVSVVHTVLDDFDQTGGDGSLDLSIDEQKSTSLTSDVGFQLGYAHSTAVAVLTPYLRASYVHEFLDENDDVEGSLDAISGAGFSLEPTGVAEDYARFGVGLGATFGQGFSQFVDYDVVALHDNLTVHQVTLGIRMEF